jgi:hypothetical protein
MESSTLAAGAHDPNRPHKVPCYKPAAKLLERCPLTIDFRQTNAKEDSGLGNLDKLPTEIQHTIFCHLDVKSFLVCRRVSRKALKVTGSVPEFEKVSMTCLQCAFDSKADISRS